MTLREEFEVAGNWLFRWRSYLPLVMVGVILLAMLQYAPRQNESLRHLWEPFCLLVSLAGWGIRIVTIGHTPRRTSGRNTRKQVAESLNTRGTYSIVRNPLYLGNFFIGLGVALFPQLWWLALIYTLAFWLYYERIIFAEEGFLTKKFGEKYLTWANATPAFLPRLRDYRQPELSFSLRNVLKREFDGLFLIILAMCSLAAVRDYLAQGTFELDSRWTTLAGLGLFVWLILRLIRKKTTLLSVEGR